ncbi:MAG TPA: AraC family transcriptional regulator, partial [Blastocatellia bacterium]
VFGLKFKPGCFYPFLKSPLSRLTNRTIPPGRVFGPSGEQLEDEILGLDAEKEMIDAAERFLRGNMPDRDETAIQVCGIVDRIRLDHEIISVDEVCEQCDLSIRALQRLFDRYVGVSPKWVIRVYRLHEIIERLESGEPLNLAALSQDLGYFDQSHFVRDFKSIAGRTPTQQMKNSLRV